MWLHKENYVISLIYQNYSKNNQNIDITARCCVLKYTISKFTCQLQVVMSYACVGVWEKTV